MTNTQRTDELDRKQTAHISGSSNDAADLLRDALQEMLGHARKLESDLYDAKVLIEQLKRAAAMSNNGSGASLRPNIVVYFDYDVCYSNVKSND